MEYGLRRYEATQRLWWFVFFIVCLGAAYPATGLYFDSHPRVSFPDLKVQVDSFKTAGYWFQLRWLGMEPFGFQTLYLIWAGFLFLCGRVLWLPVQYAGKFIVGGIFDSVPAGASTGKLSVEGGASRQERPLPARLLAGRVEKISLKFLLHPVLRLRLMLAGSQGVLSSEELLEKERRIVDADWHILHGSWAPFRWLIGFIPLMGLVQAVWLFYKYLIPSCAGQKDLQDIISAVFSGLLPLAPSVTVFIVFKLASSLLSKVENLYLAGLDAFFYDRLLSRVSYRNGDTVVVLDALQKGFQEMYSSLKRIERYLQLEAGGASRGEAADERKAKL